VPVPAIHSRSERLAAVLRNLPITQDQPPVISPMQATSVAASSGRERELPTLSGPWQRWLNRRGAVAQDGNEQALAALGMLGSSQAARSTAWL